MIKYLDAINHLLYYLKNFGVLEKLILTTQLQV